MNQFTKPEDADRTLERISKLTGRSTEQFVSWAFGSAFDPDLALVHLERWLRASSNPTTLWDHLESAGGLTELLLMLLGSSHQLADVLAQNPELSAVILDPDTLSQEPSVEQLVQDGRRMIAPAHSYSYRLDRLRFLKQSWYVRIAVNDLARLWDEEKVWAALSDVAQAILILLRDVVWEHFSGEQEFPGECPVSVVGFGKLGGRELNYSSDVDLVYVLDDEANEETERIAVRFCEMFGRALSEKMGRGALYRVDLRLRPFGSTGQIVSRMSAIESYYERFAESWEHLAMIRSEPMAGGAVIDRRWRELRDGICFRPVRGEWVIDELISMRERLEAISQGDDLKRGPGGIRDVEFMTQILQMLKGHSFPSVKLHGTCDALRELSRNRILDRDTADELIRGYTFLRQVEHRCQLVSDRQTHTLPEKSGDRLFLAKMMGFDDVRSFEESLAELRFSIRMIYDSILKHGQDASAKNPRLVVAEKIGQSRQSALNWLDSLPEAEQFYRSLVENQDSLRRVEQLANEAPMLLSSLRGDVGLSEQVLTGEIEERTDFVQRISVLTESSGSEDVAAQLKRAWISMAVQWALSPDFLFGKSWSRVIDQALCLVWSKGCPFDLIALGSYGSSDLSLESDQDVLLLVTPGAAQPDAEQRAQQFLAFCAQVKQFGGRLNLDLRLRPEGRQGLLVRTLDGFARYEETDMEIWERFALGRSRLIWGTMDTLKAVRKAAFGQPLTPVGLDELLAMKHRIETERVSPQLSRREVKLGWGGLDDIDWLVQLSLMRYSELVDDSDDADFDSRLSVMVARGVFNTAEQEELRNARLHHINNRMYISLLGYEKDLIPENPDKLDHLAKIRGFEDGNAFLALDGRVRTRVREIYGEAIERLRRLV